MQVLLKINAGLVAPQLPDGISNFHTQSTVVIDEQLNMLAQKNLLVITALMIT